MKRRWVFWLLVVGFLWVLVSRFAEIDKLVKTLESGRWECVFVAALLQVFYYLIFTGTYQAAFATVELHSRLRELLPVTLGSLFVNVVAPAGGAAGAALFVDDAARRGQSPARAAAGTLLQLACDFWAFGLILIAGLAYLFTRHDLQFYEVIAAAILLAVTLGLSAVLALALWRIDWLRRLFGGLQRASAWVAGRLPRVSALAEDWAERNAAEFGDAAAAISAHPLRLALTLGVALAAHLVDIFSLYVLFLAFGGAIKAGPLIAGYAMGILFWIVSPTPQGIGVVEGMMALVYTSLGVPAEIATTVSLAFRGLTFWLPLALGFVLLRRVKTFSASERSLSDVWSVRIAAILAALMGVVNVLSAVTPSLADRLAILERYSPMTVRHGGHLTAALSGFALLLVARNLWRRKRLAWLIAVIVLGLSAASHLIKGLNYEEALLSAALALWLFSLHASFHARSDRPSIQGGVRALILAFCFTLAYGVIGFYLLDRHFSVNFGFSEALRQTVVMFTQFYDPGLVPITGFGRYFAASIYVIGAATLGYALLMFLRPVFIREPATPGERARASEIVQAYGRSSLARFTLFDDKAYHFSPGGSVVAFALKGRVAVALGDPVGPAGDIPAAIHAFKAYCAGNDWSPVFYQTLPDYLERYKAAGFETICIGNEAIVDLGTFKLEGKAGKPLRTPLNHMTKLGFQFEVHRPPITPDLLDALREISDEWLTMVHGSEKRFSLGWFDDGYIRDCLVAVVHTPEGQISAFTNVIPEYQKNEANIDLMRHRREAEPGTMDFLLVSLLLWARDQGFESFNLGLSALSGVGASSEDPAIERLLHFIYENVNQFYNFKGLHEYKEKFHPEWSPRYLIFPSLADLGAAWMAVVQANSGDLDFPLGYIRRKS